MFKVHFNRKILIGFLIALGILTWLAIYSYRTTRQLISSSQWVAHTHEVLFHAEQVLEVTSSIEIGQRGYALTGNEKFLEPYINARSSVHAHFDALQRMTMDNPKQQQRMAQLGYAIDELLSFSSSAINVRRHDVERARQLNATLQGKVLMDTIRGIISGFESEEKLLLTKRTAENEDYIVAFNLSFISLLMVTGLTLFAVFFAINTNFKARIDAEKQLKQVSDEIRDLYDNAPCGYHSLNAEGLFVDINNTLLGWLGYTDRREVVGKLTFKNIIAPEDLKTFEEQYPAFKQNGFVKDLEFNLKRRDGSYFPIVLSSTAIFDASGNFVKSRSNTFDNTVRKQAEIRVHELNKELEAFSYSVSHDLRAPLRSIDGYARVLQEDFGDKIDDEGKKVINVITNNAKRMGKLIDDLLDFSRLGRKDAARSYADMTPLVKHLAEELATQENGRKINIKIDPLIPAPVDTEMIRQVWVNLLSNAIKYTGKTEEAFIEVTSFSKNGSVCYSVKDNGVGFDMQYSGKLFGVFQRLHKMQEFTGTGVGLAIVKRIVDSHRGHVWAEGVINQGATFYFSIPSNGKQ